MITLPGGWVMQYNGSMIRYLKPSERLSKIRSGYSTLMVQRAINGNRYGIRATKRTYPYRTG